MLVPMSQLSFCPGNCSGKGVCLSGTCLCEVASFLVYSLFIFIYPQLNYPFLTIIYVMILCYDKGLLFF